MSSDKQSDDSDELFELIRVQPFEAEVVVARLRASGIEATLGSGSIYESVSFADGVSVWVHPQDAGRATAILGEDQ
jgi:hypothetical protein